MRKLAKLMTVATLAATVITGPAFARAPLRDVPQVTEKLITAAIAYEISRRCESIELRMLRGVSYLNGIKSTARNLGYSNAEIDAFTDNRAEKNALEAIARARIAEKGAVVGQAQSYCRVGRAEIAAGSEIGRLLR